MEGNLGLVRRMFGRASSAASADIAQPQRTPSLPASEAASATATRCVDEARALLAAGRVAEALAEVDAGLERFAGNPDLEHVRALVLVAWRRYREANAAYRRAEACGSKSAQLYVDAGWCAYLLGDLASAERSHERAIALAPDSADAHFALAVTLKAKNDFAAALARFNRVRALSPGYPDCTLNVAMCERGLGNGAAAEALLRRAIEENGRDPRPWCVLGLVLMSQDRCDEAFEAFRRSRALELDTGDDARSLAQHAASLIAVGRAAEARDLCESGLPVTPDASAHSSYAFALLTTGNFREGWAQYENRWFEEPMRSLRARYPQPVWSGQPLAGKTILLRAEQGFGDIVQFARYATPLKALGASVVMQVHRGILELAEHFADVDRVFSKEEAFTRFDYYVDMMGLPRAFGTDLATIPSNVPYVGVDASRASRWAQRIGDAPGLRVGVVWAGNPAHARDRHRSIALESLAGLWHVEGVRYVSLQKEPRPGDAEKMPGASVMLNLGPELESFADTAAVIDGLDLVICIDTAIAHLAGALGKPVWLLLPKVADFRWMQDREDSPWYPTMRLFRQETAGDWNGVVGRVAEGLREVARGSAAFLTPPREHDDQGAATATASGIARVSEARDGIVKYMPELDAEARSIPFYGDYLSPALDIVARILPIDAHVVEVGSGFGTHALWMAKVLGPDAQLFLYEYRPLVRQILSQNLEANAISTRATLVRGSLVGMNATGSEQSELPLHVLDDLRLTRLDLMKVQEPGPALDLLDGAEATLWRLRPRLLLAAHDDVSLSELAQRVKEYGYRCWRVEVPLFDPRNFARRDHDIFDGGAWLALLAVPEEVDVGSLLSAQREL